MPTLVINKKANFNYEILEKYEAGLVLLGHEVKSLRQGNGSLKGAYITLKQTKEGKMPEVILKNSTISKYKHAGNLDSYDPERERKLLLKKRQILYFVGKKKEQGLTLVPIKIYTKDNFIKLSFGLARGKKKYDKREDLKKKDVERQMRTLQKMRNR